MKQHIKRILPYAISVYIGAAFMNMCTNLTGSVLSDIMTYYHMNLDRGGMMSFFQFLGGIAAIIIIAGISDRMKKPFLLLLAFALTALVLLGIGVRPPMTLFMILYLLMGATLGMIDMSNNAVLSDLFAENRDSALSVLHGVCGLGAAGIPLITAVIGTGSWGLIYRSVSLVIFGILIFQLVIYLKNRTVIDSTSAASGNQNASAVSGNLKASAVSGNLKASAVSGSSSPAVSTETRTVFRNPHVWIAAVSVICYGASQGGITVWGVKYCRDIFTEKGALACAMALSLYWFGTMIGRLGVAIVPSLRRIKSRDLVIWGGILAGIALFAGLISGQYILLMAGIFVFGILNAAVLPRIISMMADWYPDKTGLVSGIACISLYIGLAVVPLLMGEIGEAADLKLMMMTPVLMTVLSGVFGIFLPKKTA
ncbi:MAG: MFS transporter [Eubacterium sp.]|nr:MFS transporter [Eubacterium sp.]